MSDVDRLAREMCGCRYCEDGAGDVPPSGTAMCRKEIAADILGRAVNESWRSACSAVSDAIGVYSMSPARPTRDDLKAASDAVIRARRVVTEVSRHGAPSGQQERLD